MFYSSRLFNFWDSAYSREFPEFFFVSVGSLFCVTSLGSRLIAGSAYRRINTVVIRINHDRHRTWLNFELLSYRVHLLKLC